MRESGLDRIDYAINEVRKNKLHVVLEMHRAPGYNFQEVVLRTLNEPFDLRTEEEAQQAFIYYWGLLAKRYKDLGSFEISFELLNEPMRFKTYSWGLSHESYSHVMAMAVNKIREISPNRIIMAQGLNRFVNGDEVAPELIPLKVGQTIHSYQPVELTHYRMWIDAKQDMPVPEWPTKTEVSN